MRQQRESQKTVGKLLSSATQRHQSKQDCKVIVTSKAGLLQLAFEALLRLLVPS